MPLAPIRVELESFCQEFSDKLEPFREALEQGTARLREALKDSSLKTLVSDLQDNQHRLKILLDKAHQQNTYLVIFGPLKSGKSTLMNAISGAYVSEVTSLPAYPCLVYVREGETQGFSTTAFNGDRKAYRSHEELHGALEKAHQGLARRLREADATGKPFNPAQDFTEAVRRIDFTMPAPYLRESGTILVDTPGLYTKMKYNYGQLTRDFRDTAACAVFVVKTDNLFFEQVFEEFADLLEIFSRVFLVVNIDSSKQDLGPDGSLRPALEQQDPKRIVEAFENLTVSSQISAAIDSGRLRIYLIDLLQTAHQSLQTGNPAMLEPEGEDAAALETEESTVEEEETQPIEEGASATAKTATEPGPRIGFDDFLEDLTSYLNSSEYIIEFMGDSLRQADSILHEARNCARGPQIAEYRSEMKSLQVRVDTTAQQVQTLNQLLQHEWSGLLQELAAEIRQQVTEHSGSVLPDLEKALHQEVESWTLCEESMHELVIQRVCSPIRELCQHSRVRALEVFERSGQSRHSGVRIDTSVNAQLTALGLNFDDIYAIFQSENGKRLESAPELPDVSGLQEALPLRRRLIDWILLRSAARVKQHVFGNENPSKCLFSARAKAKRLNTSSIEEFCAAVGDYARQCHLVTLQEPLEDLLSEYQEFFQDEVRLRIAARQQELQAKYEQLKGELDFRNQVIEALNTMESASDELENQVGQLQNRFIPHKAVFDLDDIEENVDGPSSSDPKENPEQG